VRVASEKIVTLVIVTHSADLAALAARHIRMKDGRIENESFHPAS
jgi:predicted ABC-type transport system involved in lysophospholipase L1 biosynthesis ATPase subunit